MKDIKDTLRLRLRETFIQEKEAETENPAPQKPEPHVTAPKKEEPAKDSDTGVALNKGADEKGGKALYASVTSVLNNPMINHAEVIRQLWSDSDNASARSLFRKKLNREKMTNGEGHYEFTLDELIKIKNIVNKAGKAMAVAQ
jgi:hypothetical protein